MAFGPRLYGLNMKKWAVKNKEDGKNNETMGEILVSLVDNVLSAWVAKLL